MIDQYIGDCLARSGQEEVSFLQAEGDSPPSTSSSSPYKPLPPAQARTAIKLYLEHRKHFIRNQLECNKRMKQLRKMRPFVELDDSFLAHHRVFWRRPYDPADDPDMADGYRKLCFLKAFKKMPPTQPKAFPCRRSVHTLPNTRVEEHLMQPILWKGLEAYDKEFSGLLSAPVDLATYLAKFLASQERLKGDNMPRYGRTPTSNRNS